MTKQYMEKLINDEINDLTEMQQREVKYFEETEDETTREMHEKAYERLSARKYEALIIRNSLFGY